MLATRRGEKLDILGQKLLVLSSLPHFIASPISLYRRVIEEIFVIEQYLVERLAHLRDRHYDVESHFLEGRVKLAEALSIFSQVGSVGRLALSEGR